MLESTEPRSTRSEPRCYFCGSNDSMPPFRKAQRVFLFSMILSRLRWMYCRSCARHFLSFRSKR